MHTTRSEDRWVPLEKVIEAASKSGVEAIAVTDHNQIEGALRLAEMAPFPVIVGEEVVSKKGEIAGLFLHERIPPGLPIEATIARIRQQGGLAYAPRPPARDVPSSLGRQNVEAIIDNINVVERFNVRILCQADNLAAHEIAEQRHLPARRASMLTSPGR